MSKFEPGDFLKEEFDRFGHKISWDYHLFIEEMNQTQYHVWHCFNPYENDRLFQYVKNSGHDCWLSFEKIDNRYKRIAKLPALIGQKFVRINKN